MASVLAVAHPDHTRLRAPSDGSRGTAPALHREGVPVPFTGEGAPVEEKTGPVTPPVRGLLLASPSNPDGYAIGELMAQIGSEISALTAPLRNSACLLDKSELADWQIIQRNCAQSAQVGRKLAVMPKLREQEAEEFASLRPAPHPAPLIETRTASAGFGFEGVPTRTPGLAPGRHHPGEPPRAAAA